MDSSTGPTQREQQQEVPSTHVNPWACDEQEHYRRLGVLGRSSTFISPRGLRLFTRTFEPAHASPSACICMIHGYTNDISWTFQNTAIRFASMGYTAFAMDIEGHGSSEGLKAFVPNLDYVAEDFYAFFIRQKQDPRYKNLPFFLFGESLGGGVCLLIHLAHPQDFEGAVLLSPMCKISDTIKPPWPLPQLLTFFSWLAPTWGVVPTKELRPLSFKDPAKLELSLKNPNRYTGKPRLGTARELVRVTLYLSQRLHEISLPFIVMHGGGDVVTDPAVSQALFETAKSTDKTVKLYDGKWHALLAGEYDTDVDIIFNDIQKWLVKRVEKCDEER
ncbi:hypothetical protein L7F22_012915 [Adiantum nelumboides]|nr:hypothetical protein [Adiantum nelumboides]